MVSGVLQHPPGKGKSHLDLDGYKYTATPDTGSWFNVQQGYTYLLLHKSARKKDVDLRLSQISVELNQRSNGSQFAFEMQALEDIRLARNNSQKGMISILAYLSFIALSIASLGLLGLVIFSVESRRKELGIRKIIGASQLELTRLISMGFIKLLLISGTISIPIGYLISFLFLQNFLERVGFIIFFTLACFATMFGIGLLTIGSQVLTATAQNPVNALRED